MAIKVRIPTPLRKLTNNEELVEVDASSLVRRSMNFSPDTPASRSVWSMNPERSAGSSTCM